MVAVVVVEFVAAVELVAVVESVAAVEFVAVVEGGCCSVHHEYCSLGHSSMGNSEPVF